MAATQVLLFLIVGRNEPLFEAEFHKRGAPGNSDAVARQNYFVAHSALDLVEKAQWTTQTVRKHVRVDGRLPLCSVNERKCFVGFQSSPIFVAFLHVAQMNLKVIDKVRSMNFPGKAC